MVKPPENEGASKTHLDFSFPKSMILRGKKNISELFSSSSIFYLGPFKVLYSQIPDENFKGFLISVPKSRIPKANVRNKIKRRIKESLRLNKYILFDGSNELNLPFDKIAIVYRSNKVLEFEEIENKLKAILNRLADIGKK